MLAQTLNCGYFTKEMPFLFDILSSFSNVRSSKQTFYFHMYNKFPIYNYSKLFKDISGILKRKLTAKSNVLRDTQMI